MGNDKSAAEDLLRNADLAMYTAKRDRKGTFALYNAEMHARASRRLQTRSQLAGALERGEFEMYFQPIVNVTNVEVTGVEALLRWNQPGEGLVGPNRFIPLCEQTGMIVELGAWVARDVCRRAADWHRHNPGRAPMSIAINLSPVQLQESDFVSEMNNIIVETGIDPEAVVLELTENVLIDDLRSVTDQLSTLRELGLRVALDDFGSGFSSLGYLTRLPIDILKLDRRFVTQLGEPNERGLLSGTVALARSLNLLTIAEGVETTEQLAELRKAGCDRAQGYLFARPMDADALTAMLAARPLQMAA